MLADISTNKKFQFIVKEILTQKDFMNIYKEYTRRLYSLLAFDTTLHGDNPMGFRKNILDSF